MKEKIIVTVCIALIFLALVVGIKWRDSVVVPTSTNTDFTYYVKDNEKVIMRAESFGQLIIIQYTEEFLNLNEKQ